MHGDQPEVVNQDPPQCAWVLHLDPGAKVAGYVVTLAKTPGNIGSIRSGDGLVLTLNGTVKSAARVYRVRERAQHTQLFLSAHHAISAPEPITPPEAFTTAKIALTELDWPTFTSLLEQNGIPSWDGFSTIRANNPKDQAYIRSLLTTTLADDLLGPALGPQEQVAGVSVRERYLVGKLAPMATETQTDILHAPKESGNPDKSDPIREEDTPTRQSLVPSSMGMSFTVPEGQTSIYVKADWGYYTRVQDPDTTNQTSNPTGNQTNGQKKKPDYIWQRQPAGGVIEIALDTPTVQAIAPDSNHPKVVIKGLVRHHKKQKAKSVTLFLINQQEQPGTNQDSAWLFQPSLAVQSPDRQAVFINRPPVSPVEDPERDSLNMLYRNRVEFAVGHGVGVHAFPNPKNPTRAYQIETTFLPQQEINVTETPGLEPQDRVALKELNKFNFFDMAKLAEMATPAQSRSLIAGLTYFVDDYAKWIASMREHIGTTVNGYDLTAADAHTRCLAIEQRLREGIATLEHNPDALRAFQFTNAAMAAQRIQSKLALAQRQGKPVDRASVDIPKNRSWRPFQLAFVLLAIASLTDPTHPERTSAEDSIVDLLWFPTGGGKTEAYLGVAAFAMAIRRLNPDLGGYDASQGLAVIMRYTLRLLTLQQFQRAAGLICAMETLRQDNPDTWGSTPFTIGLWVGGSTTPNRFIQSKQYVEAVKANRRTTGATPAQLVTCPWCGSTLNPKTDLVINEATRRTHTICPDETNTCPFSAKASDGQGIPILVVDDEIYRFPPTMLIGTVDKFAQMAWQGQVRTLFGIADTACERHGLIWEGGDCKGNHNPFQDWPQVRVQPIRRIRPPDLVIQDEFHLISGPLGTLVGLYETAVDTLCSWSHKGRTIQAKVIASTATVRKAEQQVNGVFARKVAVFPPHGVDVEDNFFAVQRDTNDKPGRLYLGICPMGISRPAALTRVYTTLLSASQALFTHFGHAADPYMTLVGYFNALRELGSMRRLCDDDVTARTKRITKGDTIRPGLEPRYVKVVKELTSRVSNKDIPKYLDQLEQPFTTVANTTPDTPKPIDVVLATNMLSVGVDVNRIGLMVMAGQPKTAAEYIQATSRVGRAHPGLVCTMLNWSRPRDLSHFERFEHFHQSFYQHVEAQSVTPFSARALDRGLTGVLVAMLRLQHNELNPEKGASALTQANKPLAEEVKDLIIKRATTIKGSQMAELANSMLDVRIETWLYAAKHINQHLQYKGKQNGTIQGLLKTPGLGPWDQLTVPNSMREVEAPVHLVMNRVRRNFSEPQWQAKQMKGTSDE